MSRYTLSAPASQDLADINEYVAGQAGIPVARYVLRELREAMRFLAKWPHVGHLRDDITDEPVKFWPVFSYLIIYSAETRPIEIVRVLQGARDVATVLGGGKTG